nr:hypothetical protein Iba_chr12dCG1450 [Ipomoea batatas]
MYLCFFGNLRVEDLPLTLFETGISLLFWTFPPFWLSGYPFLLGLDRYPSSLTIRIEASGILSIQILFCLSPYLVRHLHVHLYLAPVSDLTSILRERLNVPSRLRSNVVLPSRDKLLVGAVSFGFVSLCSMQDVSGKALSHPYFHDFEPGIPCSLDYSKGQAIRHGWDKAHETFYLTHPDHPQALSRIWLHMMPYPSTDKQILEATRQSKNP